MDNNSLREVQDLVMGAEELNIGGDGLIEVDKPKAEKNENIPINQKPHTVS